jgi:hypothetical protein
MSGTHLASSLGYLGLTVLAHLNTIPYPSKPIPHCTGKDKLGLGCRLPRKTPGLPMPIPIADEVENKPDNKHLISQN